MKYLKNLMTSLLISIGSIFILTFIITVFNYFDIVGGKLFNIFKITIPLFSLALGGYFMGKKANKNGWIEGIKIGVIITFLVFIFNIIFIGINVKDFYFYLILIISSIFGGMFGINTKKEN